MKKYLIVSWWKWPLGNQEMRDCSPEVAEKFDGSSIGEKILMIILRIVLKKTLKKAEEEARKKKQQLGERSRVVIALGIGEGK